jgi:hypothetical protein
VIAFVVLEAVIEARELLAIVDRLNGPFMDVVPFRLMLFKFDIVVEVDTPLTIDVKVLDASLAYERPDVVLDASNEAEDIFSIAPVIGLVTSISDVDKPVFKGESFRFDTVVVPFNVELLEVRLETVVVAKIDVPVAFKLVKAKLVPVALVKKRSVIEARMDLKKPVVIESAVVVAFKFIFVKLLIVAVATTPFTLDTTLFVPDAKYDVYVVGVLTTVVDPFVYEITRFVPELVRFEIPTPVTPWGPVSPTAPAGPCNPVAPTDEYCAPGIYARPPEE